MLASTSRQSAALARLADLVLPGQVRFGYVVPEPVRRLSAGVGRVDDVLGGGWPQGRISEVVGPLASGKTSLMLALLAATTQRGEVVACVDIADALHPASVAATGADLRRVLWVRPSSLTDGVRCTELLLQAGGFALVVLDCGAEPPRALRNHVWPRLLRRAEQSHTALVVLAPHRMAGSFAVLGLRLRHGAPCWRPGLWPLFDGFETTALLARNKLGAPGARVDLWIGESASAVVGERSR